MVGYTSPRDVPDSGAFGEGGVEGHAERKMTRGKYVEAGEEDRGRWPHCCTQRDMMFIVNRDRPTGSVDTYGRCE